MRKLGLGVCGLAVVLGSTAWAQVTQRVSVNSAGVQGNGDSGQYTFPCLSADSRYVAFLSRATNLVTGDTNGSSDAFVRDRWNGATELVSVDSAGMQGNGESDYSCCHRTGPSISADGRFVVFASQATNLVPGDTNGTGDISFAIANWARRNE